MAAFIYHLNKIIGGSTWSQSSSPSVSWYSVVSNSAGTLLAAVEMDGGIYVSYKDTPFTVNMSYTTPLSSGFHSRWNYTQSPVGGWLQLASDSYGKYLVAIMDGQSVYRSSDGLFSSLLLVLINS